MENVLLKCFTCYSEKVFKFPSSPRLLYRKLVRGCCYKVVELRSPKVGRGMRPGHGSEGRSDAAPD